MRSHKSSLVTIIFLLSFLSFDLQGQTVKVGENDLNIGVGFGTPWITTGYYSVIPPIAVSLDHGFRDDWGKGVITLGGYIGISRYAQEKEWESNQQTYQYGYRYTSTLFTARVTYHYKVFSGFDTYLGLAGGFRINTKNDYGTWPVNTVDFNTDANFIPIGRIFIGARYGFNEKIGCFGELGYGISYFTLGLSFRI